MPTDTRTSPGETPADPENKQIGLMDEEPEANADIGALLEVALAKVASGGELARIALAISVITSNASTTPTLIFDEVDAGIGGKVGLMVGDSMRRVAEHHQVFAITHLPQIAAFADHHFQVEKTEVGGRTETHVRRLGAAARKDELARMLGQMADLYLDGTHSGWLNVGDVTDLAGALKYVGPVAASMGISIEETTGVLAEFASQGIIGEQAGTGLRGMLMALTAPSEKAAEQLDALGEEIAARKVELTGQAGDRH